MSIVDIENRLDIATIMAETSANLLRDVVVGPESGAGSEVEVLPGVFVSSVAKAIKEIYMAAGGVGGGDSQMYLFTSDADAPAPSVALAVTKPFPAFFAVAEASPGLVTGERTIVMPDIEFGVFMFIYNGLLDASIKFKYHGDILGGTSLPPNTVSLVINYGRALGLGNGAVNVTPRIFDAFSKGALPHEKVSFLKDVGAVAVGKLRKVTTETNVTQNDVQGMVQTTTSATNVKVNVRPVSTQEIPAMQPITIKLGNTSTGTVAITAVGAVTIDFPNGTDNKLTRPGASCTIMRQEGDHWHCVGELDP